MVGQNRYYGVEIFVGNHTENHNEASWFFALFSNPTNYLWRGDAESMRVVACIANNFDTSTNLMIPYPYTFICYLAIYFKIPSHHTPICYLACNFKTSFKTISIKFISTFHLTCNILSARLY